MRDKFLYSGGIKFITYSSSIVGYVIITTYEFSKFVAKTFLDTSLYSGSFFLVCVVPSNSAEIEFLASCPLG